MATSRAQLLHLPRPPSRFNGVKKKRDIAGQVRNAARGITFSWSALSLLYSIHIETAWRTGKMHKLSTPSHRSFPGAMKYTVDEAEGAARRLLLHGEVPRGGRLLALPPYLRFLVGVWVKPFASLEMLQPARLLALRHGFSGATAAAAALLRWSRPLRTRPLPPSQPRHYRRELRPRPTPRPGPNPTPWPLNVLFLGLTIDIESLF